MIMPENCFKELTSDGQLYEILKAIDTSTPYGNAYAAFYDTTTQPFLAVGTPQAVRINSQYLSNGISIVGGDRITFSQTGVYALSFSLQVINPDNAVHSFDCWLKYMGNNYPHSTTRFDMQPRKNSGIASYLVANFELTGMAQNAGDYVQIFWHANSTQLSLAEFAAQTSPSIPETPSVIVNIHKIA